MKRIFLTLGVLAAAAAPNADAQRYSRPPDPAVVAAMQIVKDKCTKDTPCKFKVEGAGPHTLVIVELTRQETPTSEPRPYPGGRVRLTIDNKGNLVKRVDGE
jgi:hypothetical protein